MQTNIIRALVVSGLALATANVIGQTQRNDLPPATQPGTTPTPGVDQTQRRDLPGRATPGLESTRPGYQASNTMHSHLKASQVIGREVKNDQGERLGKVQDLVVSLDSGMAPFAIIEYGGALGIGETRVAVPLRDLKASTDGKLITMTVTKDQLQSASPAATGEWSAYANEEWVGKIDRFYGQPAGLGASRFERQNLPGTGDNNRQFVREPTTRGAADNLNTPNSNNRGLANPNPNNRNSDNPTVNPSPNTTLGTTPSTEAKPADQSLTDQVNRLIQNDTSLGTASQGIQAKIDQGVVTLTGEVESDTQKQNLETRIKALAGVTRVDNQLTVKK